MFAQDSIELLKDSGIDFARNEAKGIEVHRFGEVLMSSGIVLNEDVRSFSMTSLSSQSSTFMICTLSILPGHHQMLSWQCIRCNGSLSTAAMTLATS